MSIRIIAIEDHPLMLKAIVDELAAQQYIQVVGTSGNGSELARLVRETSPNVAVLDMGMANEVFEPIAAFLAIVQDHPEIRILVLTGHDNDIYIKDIVDAGALGYILKSDDLSLTLFEGVRELYQGRRFYSPAVMDKYFSVGEDKNRNLSDQELSILRMAAEGFSKTGIGRSLHLSGKRVRNTLSMVYTKLDVHDNEEINQRVAVINIARELVLLPSDH